MITFLFWASLTALTMVVDAGYRRDAARLRGEVDFSSSSPGGYLMLALITPFLVLPVYFFATRRAGNASTAACIGASAIGLGLTFVCLLGAGMTRILLAIGLHAMA
jgi:hypothetical protein